MKQKIPVLIVLVAAVCGQPTLSPRIVGGNDAREGEWPWQVDIQLVSGNHVCGGSLIAKDWVLSAAHCFPKLSDIASYRLYMGRYQLNGINRFEVTSRVRRVVIPSSYSHPQEGQDVALVQLATSVQLSDWIQPVCLPDANIVFASGLLCYVTGWGHIREGVPLPGIGTLQKVQVRIIGRAACQKMYRIQAAFSNVVDILPDMICAGFQEGGKDSCQGDSGGPLVCPLGNSSWIQAGVVSFGQGCGLPNRPGIYSRVSSFASFIKATAPEIKLLAAASESQAMVAVVLVSTLSTLMVHMD